MCLLCELSQNSVVLLSRGSERSPKDEISLSVAHESKTERETELVLQRVLHLKPGVKHLHVSEISPG